MTLSRFLILFFCMIFLNQCSSYKNAVLKISPRAKVFSRTSSLQLNIETSSPVAKEGGKRTIAKVIGLLSVMLNPAIGGGFLSGGLHAITGPDHLAALLPASLGLKGTFGLKIGAIWGLGHGLSAMVLGMAMFFLKDSIGSKLDVIDKLSNLAESIVGISLVFIGLMGVKENFEDHSDHIDVTDNLVISKYSDGKFGRSSSAIFANGVLHGCSLDGAPSILPAIAMNSWQTAIAFLSAYSIGTMVTMSITAGAIGELSTRLGEVMNNPDLPRNLSLGSSAVAIIIGLVWIVKAYYIRS